MMGSGIKRGLFFVSICIVAMLLLYVIWPAKVIQYLTTPGRTGNDASETGLSPGSTESAAIVIRKKVPGRLQEVEASYDKNKPVVITKKVPPQKPAPKKEIQSEPAGGPSPVPASISAEQKETPPVQISSATAPKAEMTEKSLPAAAPSETAEGSTSAEKTPPATIAGAEKTEVRQPPATPKSGSTAASEDRKILPRPYSIMLASCRLLDSAQTVIKQNRRKGLLPYAVRVDLGQKGIWWRVFEGNYASAAEAGDVRRQYQLSGAMVKKTPFAVSIGDFSSETDATAEVQRLLKLKHSPYFLPGPQNRVRLLVGAFASKEGARQLQDELNARGISNQVVVR
jgi:septal ring-binding cell division protein DamX